MKATDKQIREWADRHDFQGSLTDLRCAFEDAATLLEPDFQVKKPEWPKGAVRAEGKLPSR